MRLSKFLDGTLQSLTGKYRGLQGNPCNENRDPAMRIGVRCNDENMVFSVSQPRHCLKDLSSNIGRLTKEINSKEEIHSFLWMCR